MTSTQHEVLERMARERREATVCVADHPEQCWQARFVAVAPDEDGIWAQPTESHWQKVNEAIAGGCEVEVAVSLERARHTFRTTVVRRNRHLWIQESAVVDAFLLRTPQAIRVEERRGCRRYMVPDGGTIFAQLSPADRPRTVIEVRPWDLGEQGAGFVCPCDHNLCGLRPGDALNVLIHYRGKNIRTPAHVCFNRPLSGRVAKLGVRFRGEEMDRDSVANLQELLGDLTRLASLRGRHVR
jgi:hypothetical protein